MDFIATQKIGYVPINVPSTDISLFTGIDKFSYQNSTLSHPGNNFSSYQYECGLSWVLLTQIKGPCHHYYRESLENPPQALHEKISFLWTTEEIFNTSRNCGDLHLLDISSAVWGRVLSGLLGEKTVFGWFGWSTFLLKWLKIIGNVRWSLSLIIRDSNTHMHINKHDTWYIFDKVDREVIPIKDPLTEL